VHAHPNRAEFRGVLTTVDVASDKSPRGRGASGAADAACGRGGDSFTDGDGLDYSPALDRHDARRKIGVITRAEIVGRTIEVRGRIFVCEDFPEIVAEIGRTAPSPFGSGQGKNSHQPSAVRNNIPTLSPSARKGGAAFDGLGMSYEITDALVEDITASVWVLNRVTFTGAAVLRRDKAAYGSTWIELERL